MGFSVYLSVFGVVIVIIALCFLGLGVQTFFSKKKKFPEYEVGHNEEMRKRGIYCMNTVQKMIDDKLRQNKQDVDACDGCALAGSVDCKIRKK